MDEEVTPLHQSVPLWCYIPLEQFAKPPEPTKEVIRKGMLGLWEKVWRTSTPHDTVDIQKDLKAIPRSLLDHLVSTPDWYGAVSALQDTLKDWVNAEHADPNGQIIIGAPYSGITQVVTWWGMAQKWRIIDPPTPEQIWEGGNSWLAQWTQEQNTGLVIPALERCYLRHHNGLTLLRQLIDWLWSHRCQHVIGCDSWAWSYLCRALHIDKFFSSPLTLEALDAERLHSWFYSLSLSSLKRHMVFRQADNGQFVLSPFEEKPVSSGYKQRQSTETDTQKMSKEVTDFLKHIAAYSRGIPGIAWTIWRHSLLCPPDEGAIEEEAQEVARYDTGRTIWVKPWSQLALPTIPGEIKQPYLFVLHTLLLHKGLSLQLLLSLLPLSSMEIIQALHTLRGAGLLEVDQEGIWRVTSLGYPAVRQFLHDEGYLVDVL